jgi:hypothetical protein
MENNIPKITPIQTKEYETKQSKYNVVSKLPLRSIVLGPSGSGKSILLQNMILDIYRDCFSRIYIMSPSINVDYQTWEPVKKYIDKNIQNTHDEEFYFDNFDEAALSDIINTQRKIVEYQKKHDHKKLFQILVIIDDFADNYRVSHHPLINALFTRGRHSCTSCVVATQKFHALSNIIRINATDLYVFRLRNGSDLQAFLDEVGALADKKVLLDIYRLATDEPFSFLYVRLNAKQKDDMFFIRFEKKLTF